jgi:D-aminoacyl-tRNA deacylase
MRVILQRVKKASVTVDNKKLSEIGLGYLLLVGIKDTDSTDDIEYLVRKITNLRIFSDENGKINLNLSSVGGEILSVSQFTLYADTKKGNRPSFVGAGSPDYAAKIYNKFNLSLEKAGNRVLTGKFGADMQVQLQNDGPCTIIFDTENK